MKKYFYTLILLLIIKITNAQIINGKIEYSLQIIDDENFSKGELSNYFTSAVENAKYLNFILEFNKEEMMFYSKNLKIDGIDTSFSSAFSGVDGIYYKKNNDTLILNLKDNQFLGKPILKKKNKIDWKLSNESQKIENFLCYKATAIIKFNNGVGNFQRELIAWYSPEIPYSFGPKAYGDLPGLILQLQEKNIIFCAKKINFNSDEIKITEPKGKIYTESEYEELQKKYFENEKN